MIDRNVLAWDAFRARVQMPMLRKTLASFYPVEDGGGLLGLLEAIDRAEAAGAEDAKAEAA